MAVEVSKNSQTAGDQIGRWLQIAVIGRNPKRTLARILVFVVTCFVVFRFMLLPIRVEGISMSPTYKDRTFNFVNRLAFLRHEPQRGDVVGIRLGGGVIHFYQTPGVMFLKRVVGLPGESVAFVDGRLLIDGSPLNEPYETNACDWNFAPVQVGANQYFVVGDNRTMSMENHTFGKANRVQIVGKILF
jgi:signal peptidase I